MENNKSDIDSLIAGFLTHSLNEEEAQRLSRWLDEDVSHRKEFSRLRSTWIVAGHEEDEKKFDPQQNWMSIEKRIKPGSFMWNSRFAPWWYAASLLVCFALGAVVTLYFSRETQAPQATMATTATTVSAPLGSKSNIILPDGSTVWLNAGSEIYYSSDFGIENRNLQLTGEAFFDVKSDSLNPFHVHTSGMTVKALGTRFNIKAYPDDPTMVATLEEGIIDVEIQTSSGGKITSQSVQLKPKEQLVIQKTLNNAIIAKSAPDPVQKIVQKTVQKTAIRQSDIKQVIITPNVKTELSTSWKDSKWIIRDEPLGLFAGSLERRYNLHIQFASEELYEYNFSGTFENETVEQMLTALSLAAPINYKLDKNHVVLSLNQKDKEKFNKILKSKK